MAAQWGNLFSMFCQKLIATQNCLLVYGIHSIFDSLLINQLKKDIVFN